MARKQYHIQVPGQELSPEQAEASKKRKEREKGPSAVAGFLAQPHVVITVVVLLVISMGVLGWYYWSTALPSRGSITGTVTFNGAPVTGGTISFIPTTRGQFPGNGTIDASGNYSVPACPVGPVKIIVRTTKPSPEVKGAPAYVEIPPLYSDPTTTTLEYTVKSGQQTHPVTFGTPP